jgi:hypothetical protein
VLEDNHVSPAGIGQKQNRNEAILKEGRGQKTLPRAPEIHFKKYIAETLSHKQPHVIRKVACRVFPVQDRTKTNSLPRAVESSRKD